MVRVEDKKDCCGCSACVQRCPKQCISLYEDEEGFLYPKVDVATCIDCGLCEKVCPVLNQSEERVPLEIYAAKNPNEEIRRESSSGGIFTLLAEQTIDAGGVVFGVRWNEHFEAIHDYTETKEGLAAFRGSKYVQSRVGDTFRQVEQFLKQGRQVLYSGVPCQVAGLRKFLKKAYENLLTVDIICHGCPSPGVFRWYMSEQILKIRYGAISKSRLQQLPLIQVPSIDVVARKNGIQIQQINFRDKSTGWKSYSFQLYYRTLDSGETRTYFSVADKNPYMCGFLRDLYLRPSCYACPAKVGKSGSDITLGDFWGIQNLMPEIDDDRGISAVLVNTSKGKESLLSINMEVYNAAYESLCTNNPALIVACRVPTDRKEFFAINVNGFHACIKKLCGVSLVQRIKSKIRRVVYKFYDLLRTI